MGGALRLGDHFRVQIDTGWTTRIHVEGPTMKDMGGVTAKGKLVTGEKMSYE